MTLADVATRAGVSAATVSRVLKGNYPVARATRHRVLRAVEELQYVVNGPASALAAATSDLIGVLVNDVADPFFGIIASGVQSETGGGRGGADEKLAVVCNTGGDPARELSYLTLLQRQRAAALILTGGVSEDAAHHATLTARLHHLAAGGTRVVLCGRPPLEEQAELSDGAQEFTTPPDDAAAPRSPGVLTVAFDNRGGARRLTAHLLALGHRRIGYVSGPPERTTTRHRLAGHHRALHEHDPELLAHAEQLTVHGGSYDRSSGYDGALELLRRRPDTTAILGANDAVALGACAALREHGLRIPEDVSVAGFDDLPFSADAAPALTTVRLPLHTAGARAGRLALDRETPPPGGVATVQAELMVRASTGPARR